MSNGLIEKLLVASDELQRVEMLADIVEHLIRIFTEEAISSVELQALVIEQQRVPCHGKVVRAPHLGKVRSEQRQMPAKDKWHKLRDHDEDRIDKHAQDYAEPPPNVRLGELRDIEESEVALGGLKEWV